MHVEKDDVQIDSDDEDDDDEAPAADAGGAVGGAPQSSQAGPGDSSPTRAPRDDAEDDAQPTPAPAPKKPKISITYDKYMLIMQKIVYHLAEVEQEKNTGLPRSEVMQWYLEEVENELGSVAELEAETLLIDKVLTKLVKVRTFLRYSHLPFFH